jgi:hypothetical protein
MAGYLDIICGTYGMYLMNRCGLEKGRLNIEEKISTISNEWGIQTNAYHPN